MSEKKTFFELAKALGIDADVLEPWYAATTSLPSDVGLRLLVRAYAWSQGDTARTPVLDTLPQCAIRHLEITAGDEWRGLALRYDAELEEVMRDIPSVATSTDRAIAALHALRDPTGSGAAGALRRAIPEWRGLTRGVAVRAHGEHEETTEYPLLYNLCDRTLDQAFRALENSCLARFPSNGLGHEPFATHVDAAERLRRAGLLTAVRTALLFLDFSKGGSESARSEWRSMGVDLTVHNIASRQILARSGRLTELEGLDVHGSRALVLALVASHGTVGQYVRGEVTLLALHAVADELGSAIDELSSGGIERDDAASLTLDALHVVNVCDTAAVRDNLWSDSLAASFRAAEGRLGAILRDGADVETVWKMELEQHEDDAAWLVDRLTRLRSGRLDDGEPRFAVEQAVASLSTRTLRSFVGAFRFTQIWYGEAATSSLRPASQLKMLAIGIRAAGAFDRLHHVNFAPLMRLFDRGDRSSDYRARLLDAVLDESTFEHLWSGGAIGGPLVSVASQIGGEDAATIELVLDAEANALLTLLPIYETKNSAAFHRTLKEMCDLYGLRKDDFDRVANESLYLAHMNAARSDKERMVDWCVPGEIIEVGPGGGVILDLLEERFPRSRVVGIEISEMVCNALRTRKKTEGRGWEVIEGDAYELPNHVGPAGATTIVFCAVLHEIYSYVHYPRDAEGCRFRIDSVRELIRAAWRALKDGGRIVIRDGVKPPPGRRRIRFLDPEGPTFLELFAEQFEGRPIEFEWVEDGIAELSSADAMEFLYCYTWGPASFPYEVRELYGIMEYDEYVAAIRGWVDDLDGTARFVELPPAESSYLQPGYRDGLAPRVKLTNAEGEPVALPDSNCLIVVEKVR